MRASGRAGIAVCHSDCVKLHHQPTGAVAQFATEFRVSFVRALPAASGTSRWLVCDEQQSEGQGESRRSALLELLVLEHQASNQESLLGFLELHSEGSDVAVTLQDAVIDPELGMALLLRYEANVFLRASINHRQLTVGECASVLLAGLALGLRAQSLGYCLGDISAGAMLLDSRGGLRLAEARNVHALSQGQSACCNQGVSLDALVELASEVSGTAGSQVALTLKQQLESVAFDEHPLEVALHVFSGAVTPQPLRLNESLEATRHPQHVSSRLAQPRDTSSRRESLSAATRSRYRPRFAAKSPSSRRFFIWVKNRAASAPSTIR